MKSVSDELEYNPNVLLGIECYGYVFPGNFKGDHVAVKRIQLLNVSKLNTEEKEALLQLKHENVAKLFDIKDKDGFRYF